MSEEWRTALRAARRRSRRSMASVAEQSGLSAQAVRAYETGRRRPKRDALLKILALLQFTAADANALLEQAGFAPELGLYPAHEFPEYAFRVDELQRFLDKRPWPAIATDDEIRILAANRAMQALWRFDFNRLRRQRGPDEMTLFAIIGELKLLDRIANWPEFLRVAASLNKGRPLRATMTAPERRLASVEAMAGGDPAVTKRMREIWARAKPAPQRIQADFPIVWSDPDYGELHFRSVVSVASASDRLDFRDWHPVDAATWRAVERLRAGARRTPPRRSARSRDH